MQKSETRVKNYKYVRAGAGAKRKLPKVTQEMVDKVERYSSLGLTAAQIGAYFGVSRAAWFNYMKRYPKLDDAAKIGAAKGIVKVANKLMALIDKNEKSAIYFYLTKYAVERDKDPQEKITANIFATVSQITTNDPIEASRIYQQIMGGVKREDEENIANDSALREDTHN